MKGVYAPPLLPPRLPHESRWLLLLLLNPTNSPAGGLLFIVTSPSGFRCCCCLPSLPTADGALARLLLLFDFLFFD